MEALGNMLVHLDREVLILNDGGITLGDALLDPVDERHSKHSGS